MIDNTNSLWSDTLADQSNKAPYLQIWRPNGEYPPRLAQKLRGIADNTHLQKSIQELAKKHGVDFVSFGAKSVDEESPDEGFEILYMVRGKRAREHSPQFEHELLKLVEINQTETREANVGELRPGRAHYQKLQQRLNKSQNLICSVGSHTYPETDHGR